MTDYYYVTGTSRGIGRALVLRLLEDTDARVIGMGRTAGPEHARYEHVDLDLADSRAVAAFSFREHYDARRIVLVNNAGVLAPRFLGNEGAAAIIDGYAVNIVAPVLLMNAFIATYRDNAAMRLVCNISSGAATTPAAGAGVYGATKAALNLTTRTAAIEAEATGSGVYIFSVEPGSTDTAMQATLRDADERDFPSAARFRRTRDEGGLAAPEEVGRRLVRLFNDPSLAPGSVFSLSELA